MATTSFLSYNLANLHLNTTTNIPQTHAYDPFSCNLHISKPNNKSPFSSNGASLSFGTTYSAFNQQRSKRSLEFKGVQAIPETAEGFLSFFPADTPWYAWAGAAMVAVPLAIQRIVKLTNDVEAVAETIEGIADTVGKVAEQVDKAADDMVEKLPEGKLKEMIIKVDDIAEATVREAQKVEDLMDKAESAMNAQALKRFVEENRRLAEECRDLLEQCKKWEGECALYDRDREALMDFSNEADERARESEQKLVEVKEEVRKLEEELQYHKSRCDAKSVDATGYSNYKEQQLVESFFPASIDKVDAASTARTLFEANGGIEDRQSLVTMLSSLSPYALKILALVAEVKSLQKAKDILRNNLVTAEEEVEALYQENVTLDAENKRIMLERVREKRIAGSGGCRSNSASSTKGNKRKSSTKLSSDRSVEKKIDFGDEDLPRFPLSPVQLNSPECKLDT